MVDLLTIISEAGARGISLANPGEESETNPHQIGAFANGVISHLAADYLAQGEAPGYDKVAEAVHLQIALN